MSRNQKKPVFSMTLRVQTQKAPVFTRSLRVYGSGTLGAPLGRLFVRLFSLCRFSFPAINHQPSPLHTAPIGSIRQNGFFSSKTVLKSTQKYSKVLKSTQKYSRLPVSSHGFFLTILAFHETAAALPGRAISRGFSI